MTETFQEAIACPACRQHQFATVDVAAERFHKCPCGREIGEADWELVNANFVKGNP